MFRSFFSQASASGARSTALHSLQWLIGLLLSGLAILIFAGAPPWILVCVGVCIGAVLAVFLGAYVYLLFNSPDALRSEHFSLSKMAMEKGLVGDNVAGLIDPKRPQPASVPVLLDASDEASQ